MSALSFLEDIFLKMEKLFLKIKNIPLSGANFTASILMLIAAVASAYAAFKSYQGVERTNEIALRLAEDQLKFNKPQIAFLGANISEIYSNEDKDRYEYLIEIRIKNSGQRSALDFGIVISGFGIFSSEYIIFPRIQINRDSEIFSHYIFQAREKIEVKKINKNDLLLAWSYIDEYPKYLESEINFIDGQEKILNVQQCGDMFLMSTKIVKQDNSNKWVIILEKNLNVFELLKNSPTQDATFNMRNEKQILDQALGNGVAREKCSVKSLNKNQN